MEYPARHLKDKREQSMSEHSKNTAALCAHQMSPLNLSSLGNLTGYIHDAGKLTREFVEYIRRENLSERGSVNHSAAGAEYIYHTYYLPAKSAMERLTAQLIINAVYSHHGRLYDCIDTNAQNEFLTKMNDHSGCGYEKIMRVFFREILSEDEINSLFSAACDEVAAFFSRNNKFKHYGLGMIQKFLYSALIDADRYDAYRFEAKLPFSLPAASDWQSAVNAMEERAKKFEPDTPINKLRCDISNLCLAASDRPCGIYRLSVPTGSGKTLSSLRFALNFAQKNHKSHIYYVIPYTTIIDQNAKEIRDICGKDFVLEHHSGIVTENEDDGEKYELLTQRWNAPVILTTFVQFMNALYVGKSACARRMNALCDSVIVIDEAQNVPIHMLSLFTEALNFLSEICGSTILLCTATQPGFDKLENHPLRLAPNCEIVPHTPQLDLVFKRVESVNLCTPKGMSLAETARLAESRMDEVSSLLIIMNKVSQARQIYDLIERGDCEKIYLSAKKCGRHKLDTVTYIKQRTEALRKGSDSKKLIVVSTQLVEAGVDFSFESVIRALAGADSIAQAAGRCNRSGEYNKICKLFLVNIEGEDLKYLSEIRRAKNSTSELLSLDKDIDLLSSDAVKQYYLTHFKVPNNKLDETEYPIPKDKTTIYELLSGNTKYAGNYVAMGHSKNDLPILPQAFKTAGKLFRVIDNATISVIVPYGDGEKYIKTLTGDADISSKLNAVRYCSAYSVNLYEWELKKLEDNGHILFLEDIGVRIADEKCYTREYGIEVTSEQSFLNY